MSQTTCNRTELGLFTITCEALHVFQENGNLFFSKMIIKYTYRKKLSYLLFDYHELKHIYLFTSQSNQINFVKFIPISKLQSIFNVAASIVFKIKQMKTG